VLAQDLYLLYLPLPDHQQFFCLSANAAVKGGHTYFMQNHTKNAKAII